MIGRLKALLNSSYLPIVAIAANVLIVSPSQAQVPNLGVLVDSTLAGMQGAGCAVGACSFGTIQPIPFNGSATLPFSFQVSSSNGDVYQIAGNLGASENSDGTSLPGSLAFTVQLIAASGAGSAGEPDNLVIHFFRSWTGNGNNSTLTLQVYGLYSAGFNINDPGQVTVQAAYSNGSSPASAVLGPFRPSSASATTPFSGATNTFVAGSHGPLTVETTYTIAIRSGTQLGASIAFNEAAALPVPTGIVSSVLPNARTTTPNNVVTAFATIINSGQTPASQCALALPSNGIAANFLYQTTNPATNVPTGSANTPVDIPAGQAQSFYFAVTPTATFSQNIPIVMGCRNYQPAPAVNGLTSFQLTSSATAIPDMLSIAATASNDGNMVLAGSTGAGAIAVAAIDISAAGTVTFAPTTTPIGGAANNLPLTLSICQTNSSGVCQSPPSAAVSLGVTNNQILTFSVFAAGQGTPIPYNPAVNRVFVIATQGSQPVGEASVAIKMQ